MAMFQGQECILNTTWEVYGEVLKGLPRPNSLRTLVFHFDVREIGCQEADKFESALLDATWDTIEVVCFAVEGYFSDTQVAQRWWKHSAESKAAWLEAFPRLRSRRKVEVQFHDRKHISNERRGSYVGQP